VPLYFVSTPSTIKKNNSGAVSGIGVGTFFTDIRLNYPNKSLNYSSAIHLTAPSGDTKKGFSTGHTTGNLANHIDRDFGDFSPFLDAGVGNPVMDTRFFTFPLLPKDITRNATAVLNTIPAISASRPPLMTSRLGGIKR